MLHILNGDAVLPSIRESGLPGEFRVWGDVLWEGPLMRGAERAEEREARVRYFGTSDKDREALAAMVTRWDEALESAPSHEEVVIWLEHDLHDQLQLIHHLAWFSRVPHPKVSLICIGEFPGVVPFHGLGQLDGSQLASLFPRRLPVSQEQLNLGSRAWEALTSSDPLDLFEVWQGNTSALPFLAGALQRFFEEYPSTSNGLSRTERMILEALKSGPRKPLDLFPEFQKQEERVFMGDSSFWRIVGGLSRGENRLLTLGAGGNLRAEAHITELGLQTLAGKADRIALVGIERWLGGVHLAGNQVDWRWDPATRRIVKGTN